MKEDILPVGFNGVFYFTNFSTEEFKARWNKKEYTFPPESTVPLIILDATPAEVQNIRKKFARELAEREFYKTSKYAGIEAQNPRHTLTSFRVAIGYNESELNSLVSKCLEPLKVENAKIHIVSDNFEDKLHKDDNGKPTTPVVNQGQDLAVGSPV